MRFVLQAHKPLLLMLVSILLLGGCRNMTSSINWIDWREASNAVEHVSLPIHDGLLAAGCDTVGLTALTANNKIQSCGIWLINARTQTISKIAEFMSSPLDENAGLYWMDGGQRFIFQQTIDGSFGRQTVFFFDGDKMQHVFKKFDDVFGLITPSPDGRYFVVEVCRGAMMSFGISYYIYDLHLGQVIGSISTGETGMNGCDVNEKLDRHSFTFTMPDGSTWVVAKRDTPSNQTITTQICTKKLVCTDSYPSIPTYTSTRFQAGFLASFTFIYFDSDPEEERLALYRLQARFIGGLVTVYEPDTSRLTVYHIPGVQIMGMAWSP